jgi:hypothetical protein
VGSGLIPGTLNDYSSLLNCLYFHSSRPRRLLEVLISTLGPESIVTLHKLLPPAGRASLRSKGAGEGEGEAGRLALVCTLAESSLAGRDISLSIDSIARVLK